MVVVFCVFTFFACHLTCG